MVTKAIGVTVNGKGHELALPPKTPLLNVLRNDLELNGPKFGCGLGECGACTVLIDGVAARACTIPLAGVEGRHVTTLEGLGSEGAPDIVQRAFIEAQGAQCGYCLNGMIMMVKALLLRRPDAGVEEIKRELRYNLCRCGTHLEILESALLAATRLRQHG
ncbi:nicotinate dehydrogenase subunit A [Arboricoccus pini]|uniref:Nicotinate dehydrogenase subunit A n=1 Tax=Arboricoccus pini TaxID=1963835 RepID=A0A212RJ02_9PROT|nr:(2Fe-2S)-binding protein [Arboricoccus pini]SNB72408.1 nicotinate dehydrogenase subunit A [Arboricoccus pini]